MNIRQAINNGSAKTIGELQNVAIIAELNVGNDDTIKNPIATVSKSQEFKKNPLIANIKPNLYTSNFRNNNQNQFQTPMRLNNSEDDNNNDENEYENDEVDNESTEDESNELSKDEFILTILKACDKAKQYRPKLTINQIKNCIEDDLCFYCNRSGHHVEQCKHLRRFGNNNNNNNNDSVNIKHRTKDKISSKKNE